MKYLLVRVGYHSHVWLDYAFNGLSAFAGFSMVKPVNGHFCCVCKKFFLEKMSDHCKSDSHYDKFVDIIRTKKEKIADKRAAIKEQVEEVKKGIINSISP